MADLDVTQQVGGVPPVDTEDALVVLLYLLMRDHLNAGIFEDLTAAMVKDSPGAILTNPFLANYAENVALRLRMVTPPPRGLTDEEQAGIEGCMSIANRLGSSYEFYGGIDVPASVTGARKALDRLGK